MNPLSLVWWVMVDNLSLVVLGLSALVLIVVVAAIREGRVDEDRLRADHRRLMDEIRRHP